MNKILLLIVGGSLGTLSRYGLANWVHTTFLPVPYGTLIVNLLGCLTMGLLFGGLDKVCSVPQTETLKLFLMTGFLGAFTTFSSFELESFQLCRQGDFLRVILYLTCSVLGGFLLLSLGFATSQRILKSL